jgi:ribose 1,5-bisphosphokinase
MNGRLIYIVGPSGAGKDSLLAWVREHLPASAPLHWARRAITRPADAGGEAHECLDTEGFENVVQAQGFAMHWQANGLRYGIRREELAHLTHAVQGQWVLLNGSRAYLPEAARLYPGMTVIHITADAKVLRQRLAKRGRESAQEIERRIERAVALQVPEGSALHEVRNNDQLEAAGRQLMTLIEAITGHGRRLGRAAGD